MQKQNELNPDYIFESSWEVCNKVGGIYTVLSTRAKSLQKLHKDNIFFIGPDVWSQIESPWFIEDEKLFKDWKEHAAETQNLHVRIGRWNVPGQPIAFLVQFEQFNHLRNEIYSKMWEDYGVDSLHAYGDYHESTIFAYTTGLLIESFYRFHKLETKKVVAHFNEWMLGAGALYLKKHVPTIATIFTTHATSIGRSIAGNNLPLYGHINEYDGDQMANQLNMSAKHSIEKVTAQNVDCFTTVSDITAIECFQFLGRRPDVITTNGFEKDFIPKGKEYVKAHDIAREKLLNIAKLMLGHNIEDNAVIVGTSGRYEYKNKGIDIFIDSMNMLKSMKELQRDVVAFIMVPGWIKGPRKDLLQHLDQIDKPKSKEEVVPYQYSFVTHELMDPNNDMIINHIARLNLNNNTDSKVKVIFVPSYLNGNDGILNMDYYDLLIGFDLSIFPSYYEPWGYTPHESIAFSIPTVTTTLSGFGLWAKKMEKQKDGSNINGGVNVIYRNDDNYHQVVEEIATVILDYSLKSDDQVNMLKQYTSKLSDKADWAHFIKNYAKAYNIALHNSLIRLSNPFPKG